MKVDQLLVASGLVSDVEIGEEAHALLMEFATSFVLAGGSVTLSEYSALSPASRAVLHVARQAAMSDILSRVVSALSDTVADSMAGAVK